VKLLVKLAWRNIWRNKRRTVLTVLAVAFATLLSLLSRSILIGVWDFNIKNILEISSGYVQIQHTGYQENPSLSKSLLYPGQIEDLLRREPLVIGYAPRIMADGLVSYRENCSGAAIIGLDPNSEIRVSRFLKRVNAGRFFSAGSRDEAVLGYKMLRTLRANFGDTLVVLAQGYDGVLGNLRFRIVGTVRMGTPAIDRGSVLIDLGAAQELLAMEGRVTTIALSVKNLTDVLPLRESVGSALTRSGLTGLAVLPWQEVLPELKQQMDYKSVSDWFMLSILIIIISFGILNTMLMSVTERFQEFGVTLSIGMQPHTLVGLVLMEGLFITATGLLFGSGAGYSLITYFAAHPIMLSGELGSMYEDFGFIPYLLPATSVVIVLNVITVITMISLVALSFPAFKVSKLEPMKGIRYT
jgi:putative ABC transport system permease protein